MILRRQRAWLRGWWNLIHLFCVRPDQRKAIHDDFIESAIRRLLDVPIVWKWAVQFALHNFDHEASASCIVCAAKARGLKVVHRPFMCVNGNVVCKVCNMPVDKWAKDIVCSGKRAPYTPAPEPKPEIRIIPTDWT